MLVKAVLIAVLPLLTSTAALAVPKRDDNNVDVLTWGNANFQDYDKSYTFPAGACQAITTPPSGHVGSATVDMNASCTVYGSNDCSGAVAGTLKAPGTSNTGSMGNGFRSVKCSIPAGTANNVPVVLNMLDNVDLK